MEKRSAEDVLIKEMEGLREKEVAVRCCELLSTLLMLQVLGLKTEIYEY